jgi:hypothetical protein
MRPVCRAAFEEPSESPTQTAGEPERVEPRPSTGGPQRAAERSWWWRRISES